MKQHTNWLRPLGSTGLTVSAVAAGGGPIGSMPEIFGYDVPAEQAVDLVTQLLRSPVRVIDTSNGYSDGESERRIGEGITRAGGLPADYLIATKTDAKNGDYSGQRVRQSIRESMERLGLDKLPLVYLHDPEFALDQGLDAPGGAVDVLVELQREGIIGAIGVAGGDVKVMHRFLDLGVFDVLLNHNRWTLVDRSAGALFDRASAAGMGVVNAAFLGGGLLANPRGPRMYGYRAAKDATVSAAIALEGLCREWGTDIATAALQFSLRDPRIHMSVVGISKPGRVQPLLESANTELPEEFWDAVEDLVPEPPNWLDPVTP
ncbi:aldo/keto reductase [Arthrobacter nitrophenolicus]|uniref:Aldo/keto reductase n=1 Tax=Arthrobacter nitrophenolicus TaxID=683150 RepID=A0A4V6PN71_9MICC|nr:aldo/keto reductase [Arthrobacter nitrophenolicus]TDL33948.1 aldo/keto reductase [Arthrobacter nitrophenolicus]